VQLRAALANHAELAGKLDELEGRVSAHDEEISDLLRAIRRLMGTPEPGRRPIGFTADLEDLSGD